MLHVTLLSPLVRPGDRVSAAISYVADALVQVTASFPGAHGISFYDVIDNNNRLTIYVPVPRAVTLSHGRRAARLLIHVIAEPWSASATKAYTISDMVLGVGTSRITRCLQIQTVRVAYRPNTPLRILLLYPHGRRVTVGARTDRRGQAMAAIRVRYERAVSPVHFVAQVFDARPHVQRSEQVAVTVLLPRECRKA